MTRDLTFAELLSAHRAYRSALAELVAVVQVRRARLRPLEALVLERAESVLERYP